MVKQEKISPPRIIFCGDSIALCLRQPLSVIRWQLLYQKNSKESCYEKMLNRTLHFQSPAVNTGLICIWSGYTYQQKKAVKRQSCLYKKRVHSNQYRILIDKKTIIVVITILKKKIPIKHTFPKNLCVITDSITNLFNWRIVKILNKLLRFRSSFYISHKTWLNRYYFTKVLLEEKILPFISQLALLWKKTTSCSCILKQFSRKAI